MLRREQKSFFNFFLRRGFKWVGLVLLSLVLLSPVRLFADEPGANAAVDWLLEATNHLGKWIWDTNTLDNQPCRLGKAFEIPAGAKISHAPLLITVENGYTLFWNGQEI